MFYIRKSQINGKKQYKNLKIALKVNYLKKNNVTNSIYTPSSLFIYENSLVKNFKNVNNSRKSFNV